MPVTSTHRLFGQRSAQWKRCRDAYEGTDAVKAAGTAYLPQLKSQKKEEYDAYKNRALWFGATGRTVIGLSGAIMRKDPDVTAPESIKAHLSDVTLTGLPLHSFAQGVVEDVLCVGRVGVLLDLPKESVVGEQARPYWVAYTTEQIVNWHVESRGGVPTVVLVVLKEQAEASNADEFVRSMETRYRVLRLEGHTYTVEEYRVVKGDAGATASETMVSVGKVTPIIRGNSLSYIPFVFFGPMSLMPEPAKPPLLDLVDVNFSHYMSSADLEHGRHFTALPTPYITGMGAKTELHIGSAKAWVIPSAEAKVGMLEFTGSGLSSLENACETKKIEMAVLGARMLEEQKLAAEAADTLRLRNAGETSMLATISETASQGLTRLLRWHVEWVTGKADQSITVSLNKDFGTQGMTPQQLSELVKSWQSGAISYDTLYWNLKRGEVTRPNVTHEEEKALIEAQTPDVALGDLVGNALSANRPGEPVEKKPDLAKKDTP